MNTYINYDLRITLREGKYHLRADCSLAGTANGQCAAPFSDEEIDILCWQDTALQSDPKEIGQRLYDAIFQDKIGMHLRECLAAAIAQNNRLRIRLHLSESPQLARLPWEYLYDVARDNFFALSIQTPIVRYLEMSTAELTMRVGRTIHILVMIADPSNLHPRLDVDKEWHQLQAAFQDLENDRRIKLHRLPNATKLQLQRYLRKNEIDIFHFIGHGLFDERREEGLLAVENDEGQVEYISADVLARLLKDNMPRLVYLNSCATAQTGVHDPLTGTAQELVQQGVPAVVAMQSAIQDDKAIQIAHEFYLALTDGYPVDAALAEGRKAVFSSDGPAEWGTPVLFMRSPDGILWDNETTDSIGAGPEIIVAQPPVPGVHGKPTPTKRKGLPMVAWLVGAIALLAILWFSFGLFTQNPGNSVTLTPVIQSTSTHTPTQTPIPPPPIPVVTNVPTNTATATPTDLPTSTSTATVMPTNTVMPTGTPTETHAPTQTPTSPTPIPVVTNVPVDTATATATVLPTSTSTATETSTATVTPTNTVMPTSTPTATSTVEPTLTATSTKVLEPIQGLEEPGEVAKQFYNAIDASAQSGDFTKVYSYLSAGRQAKRSYADFAAGFTTTAGVEVESREQLEANDQSAEVRIIILATDIIGEAVQKIRYDIVYQMIVEGRKWKMDTARVTELYGEAIIDGIVYVHVPAGKFIMGSTDETIEFALKLCQSYYDTPENCELSWYEDELPQHTVKLDSYWIMQTEVTNDQYDRFIAAGGYDKEEYWSATGWSWRNENDITGPGNSTQNSNLNGPNQPIIDIGFYEAEAYTNWLTAKTGLEFGLPTEAEWEKAARGTEGYLYPWGDSWDGSRFNYCDQNCTADHADKVGDDGYRYSAPVGSYPAGASPYGALDMAGNVWEWTTDFYDRDYYASAPDSNPTGPESGDLFVVRGGAWSKNPNISRTAYRGRIKKALRTNDVGFRVRLSSLD